MRSIRIINGVRAAFMLLCFWLGGVMALGIEESFLLGATVGGFIASIFVAVEILASNWSIRGFTTGTFGLLIGIFCAWLVTRIDIFEFDWIDGIPYGDEIPIIYKLSIYFGLGYIGTSLAVRSNRDEFSFIVPYMRFRQEGLQEYPTILDSNILIDGRIRQLVKIKFINGPFVVPRFVLDELQLLADSTNPARRERGKRGLNMVSELQDAHEVEVNVHDDYIDNKRLPVDTRLIQIARRLSARLMTNDVNLAQVAKVQMVPVLNLNELANAMRPQLLIGDTIELELTKPGKDAHQAVGYLEDGTMIVVNHASQFIGQSVEVLVSSTIQTSSGRLTFGELAKPEDDSK
ncbi:PIN/TRAM domain-containing protein [Sulfuriroseicoccus oceanibius]|uniref:TRAM domain-containing protein n=1 Tax=Sulfuriroseicoccus oceanibius TaxID=2707525 RepID=A0A6B3LD08_9BACT|nr:TRAM domain-containing protein [Sulfuriroseicoccus oceanibius]QQL45023.1 TRAM domain-containing protein [Sulfuriroseicoccus oceanibius]